MLIPLVIPSECGICPTTLLLRSESSVTSFRKDWSSDSITLDSVRGVKTVCPLRLVGPIVAGTGGAEDDFPETIRHLKRIGMLPDVSSHRQASCASVHCALDLPEECFVIGCFWTPRHEYPCETCGFDCPPKRVRCASVLDLYRVRAHFEAGAGCVSNDFGRSVILDCLSS